MFTNEIKIFFGDESGQGITEYGAILAFVSMLVALVFSAGNGTLLTTLQNCFTAITNNLSQLPANSPPPASLSGSN